MSDRVRITEVGPRDGLQNEPGVIPAEDKVRLVQLCAASGVDEVEVTSFVSPKWVPQLGDADKVLWGLYADRDVELGCRSAGLQGVTDMISRSCMLSALIPNETGMQTLLDVSSNIGRLMIGKIGVFTAASETFSRKNTNAAISEAIQRFVPVIERARSLRLLVRGYISCVIACPFEGPISPLAVVDVARRLIDIGVDEIDLGDTIGAGTPETVRSMLDAVHGEVGDDWWTAETMTLHLHDTFGRAADCVKAALDLGVRSFDGSVAGLGGCPYASTPGKRTPGNISTETLVRTIHDAGYETGVDLDKLADAAAFARQIVAKSRAQSGSGA